MVGNKHKNGIICRFPGCDKTMRTQKFKMHFTKAHLKQGEVYSVEHRRQFEVAREDNSGGGEASAGGLDRNVLVKRDSLEGVGVGVMATSAETAVAPPSEEVPRVETLPVIPPPEHQAIQTIQTIQTMQPRHSAEPHQVSLSSQLEVQVAGSEAGSTGAATSAGAPSPGPIQHVMMPSTSVSMVSASSEQINSNKRPASAMEASAEAMDPSNALLVEFVALMDQRFQELVGKMGEMIDVQKQLIDALQCKNPGMLGDQAPAQALVSAAEAVMKRRKRDGSPSGSGSKGANNGFVL